MDRLQILVLRPWPHFALVGAELKRVTSLSQYMMVEGTVRSSNLPPAADDATPEERQEAEALRQLATLCEELQPSQLYAQHANRQIFKHERDLWASPDPKVKAHIKRMADTRLAKALQLAHALDIPMLYAPTPKSPLHIDQRLRLDTDTAVTPIMNFRRHGEGISYWLQLRIAGATIDALPSHGLTVLTHTQGFFVCDGTIYRLGDGYSGKLLSPFAGKPVVEIPQKMENDYFRRFILKHVVSAEIHAEGFDIDDVCVPPQPRLVVESAIDGRQLIGLRFGYQSAEYTPQSKAVGRVTLAETDGGFRFTRQLRAPAQEQQWLQRLRQMEPAMTERGTMHFDTAGQLVAWLRRLAPALRQVGFQVVQPANRVYYIGPLSVEQSDTWTGDWLQTNVNVVLDEGRRIPFLHLRDNILKGDPCYMLPTGELLIIPDEWLQRYADLLLMGSPSKDGFRRHRTQMPTLPPTTPHPTADRDVAPPTALRATLRPYQQKGYEWLWQNLLAQTGCCLSDEMGLGKTLQTIALLLKYKETLKTKPRQRPQGQLFTEEEMGGEPPSTDNTDTDAPRMAFATSLVVAPASVVHNWQNEMSRFAPSLLVMAYTGATTKRREKRGALMRWDVVLTTYRTLLNDIDHLADLPFGIVVFDESQAFKTHTSQIHHAVARLQAMHRLALSGTPVENNLDELWSLMSVISPHLLGDFGSFKRTFADPIAKRLEQQRGQLLSKIIAPYFLKRTKEQVLGDLPERQDEVVVCPMTDEQQTHYATELSKARNEWLDPHTASTPQRSIHLLAAIQRLRQIANGEGKMRAVFDHLESLRTTNHKVLIFSEYVSLLQQVSEEMEKREWSYELLTGQTLQREQVIARFQNNAACQFFLISLKAGGVGLNLTAADYVMLLDPWWNRAAEEQAIARAHRIGQHRAVFVYRFVSQGTLEEQILSLQDRKQTLIDSVMPFIEQADR